MSTNKTTNLVLHSWIGTDQVKRTEFNENFNKLDAEIVKNATQLQDGRLSKEDKTKLDGIAAGANKYVHPSTHPATIITEDTSHRFVTDSEKSNWNSKAAGNHSHSAGDLPNGTTSAKGVVQLSTSTTSTSTTLAATPSAVKAAMDKANAAFTSASNGKNKVGVAVTDVDPNVVIQDADGDGVPTYDELATAIRSIQTGKKFATGTLSPLYYGSSKTVNGLDFIPRILIINGIPSASGYSFNGEQITWVFLYSMDDIWTGLNTYGSQTEDAIVIPETTTGSFSIENLESKVGYVYNMEWTAIE
jgi:hypothetical protein